MLTKCDRLDAVIDALCGGNASAFARAMGLRQTTISAWRTRNTMDYDKIAEAYPQVSAEWLLRGVGNVLREDSPESESNTPLLEMEELRAEVAELRERCARLTDALLRMHEDTRE